MTNKKQEKEITDKSLNLEVRGAKEEEKLDALKQYGRRQNLEIVGIPIRQGENTNEIVKEVAQLIDVKLTNDQISTSHRLPSKSNRTVNEGKTSSQTPPPIIVRFVSRDKRNKMMANRHRIRQADLLEQIFCGRN